MKYSSTGIESVEADSIEHAAEIIALAKARRKYGQDSQCSILINNLYPGDEERALFQIKGTVEKEGIVFLSIKRPYY